jgi:hypothetical protein
LKALTDLRMGEILAPLQSLFTSLYGINEAGFFLEVSRNNVLHHLGGIAALLGCRVRQLRFASGGKCISIASAPSLRVSHPVSGNQAVPGGWDELRADARVRCRMHDLRHTFATRLAENGASESTMLALLRRMSRAMLERYSHIRMAAKREADAGGTLRQKTGNSEVVPVKVPVAAQIATIQ